MNLPTMRSTPWKHQQQAFDFGADRDFTLFAMGLGTGKSLAALMETTAWDCRRVLVLCPASVRNVWRGEIPRHCPDNPLAMILDGGSVATRTKAANAAWNSTDGPGYWVLNYEAAIREPMRSWMLDRTWDATILDEAHTIAKPDSQVSLFAAELGHRTGRRIALTGTPLAHRWSDIYGIWRYLDPTSGPGEYKAFLRRYAKPSQDRLRKHLYNDAVRLRQDIIDLYGPNHPKAIALLDKIGSVPDYTDALPGLQNAAELEYRMSLFTFRCRSEDVLDLPPLIEQDRTITLRSEGRRIYNALVSDACAEWDTGRCVCNDYLSLITRLQQVTSGYLPNSDGIRDTIDTAKRDALVDLLTEAGGEPTVVFCRFIADLQTVRAAAASLGLTYREISHRDKSGLTKTATLTPGTQVCGVQPKSGGVGVNLSAAKVGIWYSYPRYLAEYDQCVKRLHRPGTTGVRFYTLIAGGTIDEDIQASLKENREITEGVIARMKQWQRRTCAR